MYMGSKFDDVKPLLLKTIHEKIVHGKMSIESIKQQELEILKTLNYRLAFPTPLDFLKPLMLNILNIQILNKTETLKKEEEALQLNKLMKEKNKT